MAITDPAGTTYVNNMYVTKPTAKAASQTGTATHTATHQTSAQQTAAGQTTASQTAANQNATSQTSTQNELAKNFTELLQTVMTNRAVSSISDFSGSNNNSGNNSSDLLSGLSGLSGLTGLTGLSGLTGTNGLAALSGLSGLSGLGTSANSLLGLEGADSSYMSLMLLYLMMAAQNKDGQNNALINALTANTSTARQSGQTSENTAQTAGTAQTTDASAGACKHAVANAVKEQNEGGIPSNSWIVANPALTNLTGTRNAALYSAIINQFNVEDNERYRVNKQGIGDTYCNIYTWDITRAMGAEIPHFIEEATGKPVASGGDGIKEMTANDINDWLHTYGEQYGWTQVTAEEAQTYANQGSPAITSWKNPDGHGHLQVVCPSQDGTYNQERGVTISQAGRYLKQYDYIDSVYGENGLRSVEYFVHK